MIMKDKHDDRKVRINANTKFQFNQSKMEQIDRMTKIYRLAQWVSLPTKTVHRWGRSPFLSPITDLNSIFVNVL